MMEQEFSSIYKRRMMEPARILIIDYNTFYYQSFDIFRMLLMNREWFHQIHPKLREFPLKREFDQLDMFINAQTDRNIFQLFQNGNVMKFPEDIVHMLDILYQYDARKCTETDLGSGLHLALRSKQLEDVYVLRHHTNPIDLKLGPHVKEYRTPNLFDLGSIVQFIQNHHINSVILDSLEFAFEIAEHTKEMSFLFGTYRYNFNQLTSTNHIIYKNLEKMNDLEVTRGHEYGRFEPFSQIQIH